MSRPKTKHRFKRQEGYAALCKCGHVKSDRRHDSFGLVDCLFTAAIAGMAFGVLLAFQGRG